MIMIKCDKCDDLATNFVKRMVMVGNWAPRLEVDSPPLEGLLGYWRRELIEIVRKDVEEDKNEGENYYCDTHIKEYK